MTAKKYLPKRMRQKSSSSGRIYYYYDTCAKPRKWLPLGCDFLDALKKYADLEMEYNADSLNAQINAETTFARVADEYVKRIIPQKAPRTQRDNMMELKNLLRVFKSAPINEITPKHVSQYLDWRSQTAKVRANREIALLSNIFNKAREWGYTNNANPCSGIKKNRETGRDNYVTDDMFALLFQHAERHIQYLMLVAYLTGQRVADCLKMRTGDIQAGELWIAQNKVKTKLRIRIDGTLKEVIDALLEERGQVPHDFLFVNLTDDRYFGKPVSYSMLRGGMDRARKSAGIDKARFQFRDLRAKAATDKDEMFGIEAARTLLGHTNQSMTSKYIRHRKGRLVDPINSLKTEKM